jgi:hypothetical protein
MLHVFDLFILFHAGKQRSLDKPSLPKLPYLQLRVIKVWSYALLVGWGVFFRGVGAQKRPHHAPKRE